MKNYKLSQWVLTAGETHVSLGCVDFSQLLFGLFDGDLTQPIHFLGVDSALVSIVRCKVIYQMILNQVMSRSILQVWFSSGWSNSTLKDFIDACNQLLKSRQLQGNLLGVIDKKTIRREGISICLLTVFPQIRPSLE